MALHDQAMLSDSASIVADSAVASFVRVAALIIPVART